VLELLPYDCYEKDIFKDTLNYLKSAEIYLQVRELLDIQMEAQQNGEYELSNRTITVIWDIWDTKIFKKTPLSSGKKFKTVARADMNVGKLKSLQIDGFEIQRDDREFERRVTAVSNMENKFLL
jgi:hypothetical protein